MLWYQVFLEATKTISQSQVPLLHEVIPLFDILTHHIDKYVENMENFPAVHDAARQGGAMMDKYYGLTDESIVYHIAMSESVFLSNLEVDMFHQCFIHTSSLHTLSKRNGHGNGSPLWRIY